MNISISNTTLQISLDTVSLMGDLHIPDPAGGLVIFSHGSGSSRLSPRNRAVARTLQRKGLATLLFDLLTPEEDQYYQKRFDIDLLTNRLVKVTQWLQDKTETRKMSMGYFGASTGAASALNAAAILGRYISAVVSRGGRPDLAMNRLPQVVSPTLLLVGSMDIAVIELNKKAFANLECEKELIIVPGASHLFEEPGKLEEVASLSATWFNNWL